MASINKVKASGDPYDQQEAQQGNKRFPQTAGSVLCGLLVIGRHIAHSDLSSIVAHCELKGEVNRHPRSTCLASLALLYFESVPPSSSGLGHWPFKPVTGIRVPLGAF